MNSEKRRGTALIAVLMLFVLVAVAASLFMSTVHGMWRMERHHRWMAECRIAAMSGIERTMWELAKDSKFKEATGQTGAYTYKVRVEADPKNKNQRIAISEGEYVLDAKARLSRALAARLEVGPKVRFLEWLPGKAIPKRLGAR